MSPQRVCSEPFGAQALEAVRGQLILRHIAANG